MRVITFVCYFIFCMLLHISYVTSVRKFTERLSYGFSRTEGSLWIMTWIMSLFDQVKFVLSRLFGSVQFCDVSFISYANGIIHEQYISFYNFTQILSQQKKIYIFQSAAVSLQFWLRPIEVSPLHTKLSAQLPWRSPLHLGLLMIIVTATTRL